MPSHAFCSMKNIFNNTVYGVDFSKLILSTDSLNQWLVNQFVWERMSKSCMRLNKLADCFVYVWLALVVILGLYTIMLHYGIQCFFNAYLCQKVRIGRLMFYHLLASWKSCKFNRMEKKIEVKAAPDMSHQIESGPPYSSDLTSSREDDQPFISVGLWNSLKFPSQVFTPVNPSSFPR